MSLTIERFEPTPEQVEAAKTPEERAEEKRRAIRVKLAERAFDFHNPPVKPVPVLSLAGHSIGTPGNVVAVVSGIKSGKTAAVSGINGALIRGNYQGGDCLHFEAHDEDGRAVVHFDTEQSQFDADLVARRSVNRSGLPEPPPWFFSYSLNGMDPPEMRLAVREAVAEASSQCGGVRAVVVDGGADLCFDVNDQVESFEVVAELQALATRWGCVVVVVVHTNPGSEKPRGHFGSQLERKAETNLRLAKADDGVTTVYTERSRHCYVPRAEGYCFQWSDSENMHVSCGKAGAILAGAKREKLHHEAELVFEEGAMAYSEAVEATKEALGVGERTAKSRIAAWRAEGIVRKDEAGRHHLKPL